jgi:hypothetical protein
MAFGLSERDDELVSEMIADSDRLGRRLRWLAFACDAAGA